MPGGQVADKEQENCFGKTERSFISEGIGESSGRDDGHEKEPSAIELQERENQNL